MERRTYVADVSRLLAEAAARTGDAGDAWDERREHVAGWLETLIAELRSLEPPGDLAGFHRDLVQSLGGPVDDDRSHHHGSPPVRRWEQVMVRLYTLCREEGVRFPIPPVTDDEPGRERESWERRLRVALAERGDPNPGEVIEHLKVLRDRD